MWVGRPLHVPGVLWAACLASLGAVARTSDLGQATPVALPINGASSLPQLPEVLAVPTNVEELERLPGPWLIALAGGAALLACQVCTIGYIQCSHRARYEGRTFWYRGSMTPAVDEVGCCSLQPPNLSETRTGELQHDLRNGRAYWSGNWGRDYRFHVANFHPLISVFCCHPVHPFGKAARFIVLAITLAFMVGWRRFVQESVLDLPGSWDEDLSGKVRDAAKAIPNLRHVKLRGHMVLFAYVTLPSMVAELLFTRLAVLHDNIRDFHREYSGRACCTVFVGWFITLMGLVARLLFYVLACASLAFLVYTVYSLRAALKLGHGAEELYYFVVLMPETLAQMWFIWWFVFDLLTPYCGFGLCHALKVVPCFRLFCWQWWVEEEAIVQEPSWRVADTAHAFFGKEVDDDFFSTETTAILKEESGLVHDRTQKRWVAVERVAEKDIEAWVTSKMSGAKRGEALLSQVEMQRAHSLRLRENECVEVVPCCLNSWKPGGVRALAT